MCVICGHILCKCKKQKPLKNKRIDWLSVDLFDNYLDFLYVKSVIQDALGVNVSKAEIFRHCLVIAIQQYENRDGINTLRNTNV